MVGFLSSLKTLPPPNPAPHPSVCANRIFVQDGVYDKFAAKLAEAVRNFKVGEGNGEGITHGPLIHQAAVDKVQRHVEDAKSKGAKVLVGGAPLDIPGYFYQVREFLRGFYLGSELIRASSESSQRYCRT